MIKNAQGAFTQYTSKGVFGWNVFVFKQYRNFFKQLCIMPESENCWLPIMDSRIMRALK